MGFVFENPGQERHPLLLLRVVATVGLVFVYYAALTQMAIVSEEVPNPDRNIPFGMILSLLTAMVVYVLSVYIMVGVLEPETA